MRGGRFHAVRELLAVALAPADGALLLGEREARPLAQVVHVALREDVAPAREVGVLGADQRDRGARLALGVLGAVDEAGQVAAVEVPEAGHILDQRGGAAQLAAHLQGQLEVQVDALREDVEQHVAARGGGAQRAVLERAERPQAARPAPGRDAVPELRSQAHRADQPRAAVERGELRRERRHAREDARRSGRIVDAQHHEARVRARLGDDPGLRIGAGHGRPPGPGSE
jgi:hypothetical protein